MPLDMNSPNLALWRREMPTDTHWLGDKKTTKPFKKGGGFSGTALDAMYVIARLTGAFGPVGIGWGIELKRAWEVQLPPGDDGKPRANQFVHIGFWYVWDGVRGSFDQVGGTPLMGFGDDDAVKKSVTDAVTKAASWLGVGADIHTGRWDDNKYVAEREQETRAALHEQAALDKARLRRDARTVRQAAEEAIALDQLSEARGQAAKLAAQLDKAGLGEEVEELRRVFEEARMRLMPAKAAE